MNKKNSPNKIDNTKPDADDQEFNRETDEEYERIKKIKDRNRMIIAVMLIIMLTIYFWFGY